jgi:O-antigen/teichoic acid export membrane protein
MADPDSRLDDTGAEREAAVMSVRGAAAWAMASQYLSFAIQFVTSVVVSRFFLSPPEVGLFSIALAAAMLVAILQDFGLSRYVSGLPRLDRDEIARCSSVALVFSLLIACVIALGAWPLARLYGEPGLTPVLLIIAASYLFLPLSVIPMALMARAMAFRGHFAVNVGAAAAQCATALSLAAAGYSTFSLAWATVAAGLAKGLIAQGLRPAPPWPLRLRGAGKVARFGSTSSVLYLSGALGTKTPDLIVGKVLGLFAVGLYSRAVGLADNFRMLVAGAIGSVFFPAFARIRDRGEPLGPAYLRVAAGYSALIWPGMAGLSLASEPLVRILFGPGWAGVAPLLALIALNDIMIMALPLHMDLPILMGRMKQLLALNLLDTALSIGTLALGCLWGLEGAAASRLVYGLGWLCLYARFMHRLVQFDVKALLGIYAKSACATLAALAPLAISYLVWMPPSAMGLAPLLAATAAGVALWLGALIALRHPVLDDLFGLAAGLPGARRFALLARYAG